VYTAAARDGDGTAANSKVTYSLSRSEERRVGNVDATTGAVTFKAAPDYEAAKDANHDNVYDVTVHAADKDGVHDVTQTVAISVTDVNDVAPVFSSESSANEAENTDASHVVYTAAARDGDGTAANSKVTYSLS